MKNGAVQPRLKYCWLKGICSIRQCNELEREIKHTIAGAKLGVSQNSGEDMALPGDLLESPLVAVT